MRKILYLFLGLIFLTTISCEKDDDAIYVSHKLILNAERTTEYYYDLIVFSWNEVTMVNHEGYLLVKFYEEHDITLYDDIVDYYINNEGYYDYPDWTDDCNVYTISTNSTSYQLYDYSTTEDKDYFTLLAYNSNGNYIVSNTIYF